ncbi:hypothetical protein BGZ99_000872, partial [Dissophora globulifera]
NIERGQEAEGVSVAVLEVSVFDPTGAVKIRVETAMLASGLVKIEEWFRGGDGGGGRRAGCSQSGVYWHIEFPRSRGNVG